MKKFKILIAFVFTALAIGCSDDDNSLDAVNNAPAPANLSALFTITQDNTGLVTIAPHGEGVVSYDVYFGDATAEPVELAVGQKVQHTYAEGQYNVKIVGYGITGKTTEVTLPLTVSFRMPENFDVTIAGVAGDALSINVSAEADYETFFEVWFGDDPDAEPVQFMQGDVVTHTYAGIGTYEVTVVAYSGGAATATYTEEITITNPLLLPITFENATLNYTFGDFGNATTTLVDNPDPSGINASSKVARMVKNPGAETWAGTVITLDGTIDFSTYDHFRIKVWSPAAGITVKFKIENLTDGSISHEVDRVTTVANDWEYLVYDFSGANMDAEYSKVVVFFNFGANGNGDTYYFDDIELIPEPNNLPMTFESTTINYQIAGFGSATGGKIANPQSSGINTSANVGQFVKPNGAETWAGIAMPLTDPIDFSTNQKIRMKVWSPAAGITVLMKLEKLGDNSVFVEVPATTTVANQWEELTFDFTGVNNANDYQQIVLFFDFNVPGNGATYYFDDIEQFN